MRKIKILFICHGNICRSPMAEFILKDMVQKRGIANQFEIASAATSTEEIWNGVGNPVYAPAKEILQKHNISCEGKRAVQVKKSDYDYYDYLICMDSNNIRNLQRILGTRTGTGTGIENGTNQTDLNVHQRQDNNTIYNKSQAPSHKISLFLDFTDRAGQNIADPWYTGDFQTTYDDVIMGCEGLLNHLLTDK